jgi:hypothetical protein
MNFLLGYILGFLTPILLLAIAAVLYTIAEMQSLGHLRGGDE